ncbi:peptidoglycan recognition protein [Streptomyces sp. NPDC056244]|uniref:peptidoglycan recognition protein family protein n=1 Tax=Streptomyces sp. NPDC056244 TaxID=3345762 RepID=UPI0035E2B831
MRAYLASPIALTYTVTLALPLALPLSLLSANAVAADRAAARAAMSAAVALRHDEGREADAAASRTALSKPGPELGVESGAESGSGSTQSLPLAAFGSADRLPGTAPGMGLARQDVQPFSLLGVVWDDADAELQGTVEVRTRAAGTRDWSGWQSLRTHNQEHGADPGTAERTATRVHGATAPLWVGRSDGVEVRVRQTERPDTAGPSHEPLPQGLRLDLVDPGDEPVRQGQAGPPAEGISAASIPTESVPASVSSAPTSAVSVSAASVSAAFAKPYVGPRPRIVTRGGWGADESLRERRFGYSGTVTAAFIHHSATGNNYTCRESASVLRGIYRYHVRSAGWRDFGYNFAVDKCGTIYEGRAGGVEKPVLGAHTLGFNRNTVGIAVLGTYNGTQPPAAATTAVAKLTAWKLGLHGINPRGKVTLTSAGSGKYKKGTRVGLHAIAGHRDGVNTDCPGSLLHAKLGTARNKAAQYQGR